MTWRRPAQPPSRRMPFGELFQVAEPFQGDNPRLDDTLSLMSRDLDEFASGLDAQFATAVDELMDDSEKQAKQKADEIRGAGFQRLPGLIVLPPMWLSLCCGCNCNCSCSCNCSFSSSCCSCST